MKAHALALKLLEGPDLPVHAFLYDDIVTGEIEPQDLIEEQIRVWDRASGQTRAEAVLVIKP